MKSNKLFVKRLCVLSVLVLGLTVLCSCSTPTTNGGDDGSAILDARSSVSMLPGEIQ